MTREEFTQTVFTRDKNICVVPWCNKKAVDAHHIMERRLWLQSDPYPEGYHLDNGVSVCEEHHLAAESNAIPPQAFRNWLHVATVLPKQLSSESLWDKWGKEVEKAVNIKYPRTPYLNFSDGQDVEDGCISNNLLLNKPLIITIKMDGSNVRLSRNEVAARNGQVATHASFDFLKSLHSGFRHNIPEGIHLFGEWLFAKHSIHYSGLKSYLQIFAIYEERHQLFWSWNEVTEFCVANGFHVVEEVGRRQFSEEWQLTNEVYMLSKKVINKGHEGLVVKSIYPFHHSQHAQNAAKIVRPDHVQTDTHWSRGPIVKNYVQVE